MIPLNRKGCYDASNLSSAAKALVGSSPAPVEEGNARKPQENRRRNTHKTHTEKAHEKRTKNTQEMRMKNAHTHGFHNCTFVTLKS